MRSHRRRGASTGALLLALGVWLTGAAPGDAAPGLEATDLRGARVSLSAARGRVVVVDFWASWCEPCRRAFPVLESLAQRYGSRGLSVVGVSVDEERANVDRYVRELRPTFAVVHDAGHSIAERWSPDAMPTTFVVDRRGAVRAVHNGFSDGDARTLEAEVVAALGAGP